MTAGTKTIKQKLFFSAMVLAFMWVITGDLVSIHLEVIFGKKVDSSWHHPIAKTHKDDNSSFKVKQHKVDPSKKHIDFIGETAVSLFSLHAVKSTFSFSHQHAAHQQQQTLFLRGPPSIV